MPSTLRSASPLIAPPITANHTHYQPGCAVAAMADNPVPLGRHISTSRSLISRSGWQQRTASCHGCCLSRSWGAAPLAAALAPQASIALQHPESAAGSIVQPPNLGLPVTCPLMLTAVAAATRQQAQSYGRTSRSSHNCAAGCCRVISCSNPRCPPVKCQTPTLHGGRYCDAHWPGPQPCATPFTNHCRLVHDTQPQLSCLHGGTRPPNRLTHTACECWSKSTAAAMSVNTLRLVHSRKPAFTLLSRSHTPLQLAVDRHRPQTARTITSCTITSWPNCRCQCLQRCE
jgi:hypothetical protein